MKSKFGKLLATIALTGTLAVGAAGFSSCAVTHSYYGEYSYPNAWSPTAPYYGVKVKVDVQSDGKGDRIKKVELINSVYTEVSDGWADKDIWLNGLDELLLSYRGKYLADVLAETVRINSTSAPGQPEGTSSDSVISGATQGSGRLLLAVQAALQDAAEELGYEVKTGEYKYPNAWSPSAPYYGIKVRVVVKDGTILGVGILPSDLVEVSADNAQQGWKGDNWRKNVYSLLENYKGKKVEDVLKIDVNINETTTPGQPEGIEVADDLKSQYVITGATQGSGRLLLAIQKALGKQGIPEYTSYQQYTGEYHYPNAWTPTDPDYGIKVKVFVENNVVKQVSVLSSDYADVSGGWTDKQKWIDGLNGLLEKYEGKTVGELLAIDVAIDANPAGQPSEGQELGGLVITGATQGSGRLLLAVQNALKAGGYKLLSGEYHYPNAWNPSAPEYGIAVNVLVQGENIAEVSVRESDYVEVSDDNPAEGWKSEVWKNGVAGLLNKYAGKNVVDVLAMGVKIDVSPAGQPSKGQDLGDLIVTGATQGSGRLLLAVQDAIEEYVDELGYEVVEGEYHYPNAWNPAAPEYGIRVRVVVKDGVVVKMGVLHGEYVEVSDDNPTEGWKSEVWKNGVDGLLAKYEGKTVAELLAIDVAIDSYPAGQPSKEQELGGLVVTGATQGSGRLLLAVQNALEKLQ